MSRFRQTSARTGVRAATLAIAVLAAIAVGGAGASSASAACTGGKLVGEGTSVQKIGQNEIWKPMFEEVNCAKEENPEIEYKTTSNAAALKAWRFTGEAISINRERQFLATDDAPTEAQIVHAGNVNNRADLIVVPVAQTAIAVVVHPPTNCALTQITNLNLEKAFSGKATTWSEIGGVGAGCSGEAGTLTRVVRKEGSSSTSQFKDYLAKVNSGAPCEGAKKWSELEGIGAEGEPNTTWPACGTMAPTTAVDGGGVAETVQKTAGTIGYAPLPDAKAKGASVASLQDNGTGEAVYASPATEKGNANCAGAVYEVPAEARPKSGNGENVDWSKVFGGNPKIGGSTYSICTLTYDLAWGNYEAAGYENPEMVGKTVGNYIGEIVTFPTAESPSNWYAALPESKVEANNVLAAAVFAHEILPNPEPPGTSFHIHKRTSENAIVTATGKEKFKFEDEKGVQLEVECEVDHESTVSLVTSKTSNSLSLKPVYKGCIDLTNKKSGKASVTPNGCEYRLTASSTIKTSVKEGEKTVTVIDGINTHLDLICPPGKEMTVIGEGPCEVKIAGQLNKGNPAFANSVSTETTAEDISTKALETTFEYTAGAGCTAPGNWPGGQLEGSWTVKAYEDEAGKEGPELGIWVT
jgi:ABC-type phosphate transport system substrate-binding protein